MVRPVSATRNQSTRGAKGASSKEHAARREREMLDGVRSAGLKLTPQRIAIVRAIAGDPTHPTAQEIFDRLQASMPTMSFATVYNTLDALARAGVCGSLSLSPGAARFDPNMEPHHHAVCDGCGLVRDVERHGADGARRSIDEALVGFEVRAVEHIYRGLCAECAHKAGSKRNTAPPSAAPRAAQRSTLPRS